MPYKISTEAEGCSGYAVVDEDGKVVGCHTERSKALRHQRALYANVPDSVTKSTTEELEQLHTSLHERFSEPDTDESALLAHHMITGELLERGESVAELKEWANTSFVHPIIEYIDGVDLEELGLADDEVVSKWVDAWEANEIDVFSLCFGKTVKGDRLLVKVADSDFAELIKSVHKVAEGDTFIPPEGVAREAKMALEWMKEGKAGSGFTDVGRARAAQLAARRPVSLRTIKRMASFFSRHQVDRKAEGFARGEKNYPSGGRVAHNAWGGFTGEAWAKKIIDGVSKGSDELGKGLEDEYDLLYSDVITKADEKKFTLGPLYIPDSLDAHGEWTDSEELQKAVWEYVKAEDRRIRLQHNRDVVAGEWLEIMTFPHKLTVPMTKASGEETSVTYPPNTVFMGVQWEDWAWDLVKKGKLRGYSIGGKAKRISADLVTPEEEVEASDPSVNSVHVDTIMKPSKRKVRKHGSHDQSTHNPHKGGRGGGGSSPRAGMGDIKLSDQMVKDMQGGSAAEHLVQNEDGSWSFTPERQALHDKIIADEMEGIPTSAEPTFTVMGGGPASGKSTLIASGKGGDIPTGKEAAQVNPDTMKEALPEWDEMEGTEAGRLARAGFTHEESSYLAKRHTAAAFERQTDVVLDGTGDSSPESMIGKITTARNAGYKVNGVYVTTPTEQALSGALARAAETGRTVVPEVIRQTHAGVSRTFPAITNQFDSLQLFDTTELYEKGIVKLIGSGTGGNFEVLDQAAYQTFLDKGK